MNRKPCVAILLLVPLLAISSMAQGTLANRVFMSTTGNDSNNCGNPNTPCLTFAGALAQVIAGGEVIAEATGGYGPITITKSVTLSGPLGVVIFSNYQVAVNAPGATVVLRGLTIDGTGALARGIFVTSVGNLHVESCVITGFAWQGIYFTSPGQLFVNDTIVRGNGSAGIWVLPSSGTARASVDRCRLEQNEYGLISDNEQGGTAKVTIRDSAATGNSVSGLRAESGGELNAEGCLVSNNGSGLVSHTSTAVLRASNCTVTDNVVGLVSDGASLLSRSNNTVEGNGDNWTFTGTYSAK